jgi:hypothetical protein
MIHYYIQPNGTGTAFSFTADTQTEAEGELLSLQNKGLAMEAEETAPCTFFFFANPAKLEKAFVQQFIYRNWNNASACKSSKGKSGGFMTDAREFARKKFAAMSHANWLLTQGSFPEIYSTGKISAEKSSGDWKDTLTKVAQSI